MRFKQGAADRPLIRHSGEVSAGWDLVKEVVSVGLKDVPGGNLLAWLGHKIGKSLSERFEKTALAKRLLSQAGHDDYVRLSWLTAQRSTRRLPNGLAKTSTSSSQSASESGVAASYSSTRLRIWPVVNRTRPAVKLSRSRSAHFYKDLKSVLLVVFGRDRLTWHEVDPEWADRDSLDQHLLGGFSRHDATTFLGKCGIDPGLLLEAILRIARDEAVPDREAYYPFGLGLCADTVVAERNRGVEPKPDTFDMAPGEYSKLAQRFLKSLHDEHPERWIIHLAQTPRFDEAAARAAFSPTRNVHQDKAWESLPDYSFVQDDAEPGWFRIHSVMSDVLRHRLAGDAKEFAQAHKDWRAYWQSRGSVTPTNSQPSRGITTMFSTPSKPSPPGMIKPRRRAANAT